MPAGTYLSLAGELKPTTGGQTRAQLMRNRLLCQHAGIEPVICTFDSSTDYPRTREAFRRQGQLVDGMSIVNLYEWYRERALTEADPLGHELPDVVGHDRREVPHPDGSVHYTSYRHPRLDMESLRDYRRPDGSVYLRMPMSRTETGSSPTPVVLVSAAGAPVAAWPSGRGLRQRWLLELAGDAERVIVISDSRFALAQVVPFPDPRFYVLHLVHNIHVAGDRAWNAPLSPRYANLMSLIPEIDGLVTLTQRQQDDIAARYGATNNLFVVPNPVELPPRPEPLPEREPRRFVTVSRLEHQKRLEDAVRAFSLVVAQEPGATLEIFGDGRLRIPLEEEIASLGLQESVILRGHDPRAREALWTATGFLMTSRNEGYPLASLESMSHGCPVVSYDVKYGPREQITDGVDGFLVPAEDVRAVADRVIRLARDPELVRRMSAAALAKAQAHDYRAFLADWRHAIEQAIDRRPGRTRLTSVKLSVQRLRYQTPVRLPAVAWLPARWRRRSSSAGAFRSAPVLEFAGKVSVAATPSGARPDDAQLTLDAVTPGGHVVAVPLTVERVKGGFSVAATIDTEAVFAGMPARDRNAHLRLRLVWNNSRWETVVRRQRQWAANYEVSFTADQELSLSRGPGALAEARTAADAPSVTP